MQVALLLVPATQPLADCLPLEWWLLPRADTLLQHYQQNWLADLWLCEKGLCLKNNMHFRHAGLLDASNHSVAFKDSDVPSMQLHCN